MGNGTTGKTATGKTGTTSVFFDGYEQRNIIIAEGIQGHGHVVKYLKDNLGSSFVTANSDMEGTFDSVDQEVRYKLKVVRKKNELRDALQTEGAIVVYIGHARYGRGTAFDPSNSMTGECWENGSGDNNGNFRLGYKYVPVEEKDIQKHGYSFAPLAVENGLPAKERSRPYSFHPDARNKTIKPYEMPSAYRSKVLAPYKSATDKYYGFKHRGDLNFLLHAGWNKSQSTPFDLGAVELKCRTFCHFGCSTKTHFWEIVRRTEYKGWERPNPPTGRFAYFTTASSYPAAAQYWVYYLLSYPKSVARVSDHWWQSHEWAKRKTNTKLRVDGYGFQIW
jgi:hypothetical protein